MAILRDSIQGIEIIPVLPSNEGPHDAYIVTLWGDGDEPLFRHQYNVHGWQGGHLDIWSMAKVLRSNISMVDEKSFVYMSRADDAEVVHSQDVHIVINVIWMKVIISAYRPVLRDKDFSSVSLDVFLLDEDDVVYEPNSKYSLESNKYINKELMFDSDEVKDFGEQLLHEVVHCHRMRVELDQEHFDDDLDFTYQL